MPRRAFRDRITLFQPVTALDANRQAIVSYVERYVDVPANRKVAPGKEYEESGTLVAERDVTFEIRYVPEVDETWVFNFGGGRWGIVSVDDEFDASEGGKKYIRLRAKGGTYISAVSGDASPSPGYNWLVDFDGNLLIDSDNAYLQDPS
jgi:SPP1 family predicted phage head-tail adaptor